MPADAGPDKRSSGRRIPVVSAIESDCLSVELRGLKRFFSGLCPDQEKAFREYCSNRDS